MRTSPVRLLLCASIACAGFIAESSAQVSEPRSLLIRYKEHVAMKWGEPSFGTGAKVTYAFVRHSVRIENGLQRNGVCTEIAPLGKVFALPMRVLMEETRAALARWAAVTNLDFVEVAQTNAEILIGSLPHESGAPHGIKSRVNLVATPPSSGNVSTIRKAAICLRQDVSWTLGGGGWDVRVALTHELGHVIGIDHPEHVAPGEGKEWPVMHNRFAPSPELTRSDIVGAVSLYGARVF